MSGLAVVLEEKVQERAKHIALQHSGVGVRVENVAVPIYHHNAGLACLEVQDPVTQGGGES